VAGIRLENIYRISSDGGERIGGMSSLFADAVIT
jgi:hypothetical protein